MTTLGMDTAAGLAASTELDAGSQRIAELATRLDGALRSFDWVGTDAERTFQSWGDSERPALDSSVQALASMALLIRQEAQAQDQVSGEGATAAGGAGSAPVAAPPQGFLGKVGAFITDRLGAAWAGLERTAGHTGDFLGKVGDVLTGRENHSVAEIAASALAGVGAAVGTVGNLVTGEDQKWFGEGVGVAGTPTAVTTDPLQAGQFSPALTRPTDLASIMQGVSDGYQVGEGPGSTGDVRITTVQNAGGTGAIVAIPGTENWSPGAGGVPRDLSANLNLVAGSPTAAVESVKAAIVAANLPAGTPILLTGHSQGGIIAAMLASDPAFVREHNITNVMTFGAPIDHLQLAPGVEAVQFQHRFDLVPRLDLGGATVTGMPAGGVQAVTLDSPGNPWSLGTNHSHTEYGNSVREALASDTEAGRILRDYQSQLAPFLVGPGGSASAVDVPVSRQP
ncbi:lipase family protein [Nocardioides dongxiaopingii]|uniref:lipase family protein n=1 Tax=Nocardioides sp. S-1144 TaxID=2582905 RepID=UPI00110D6EB8|nr:lipase family protein [Nocardioides sp. S-1144]QCW49497.1 lipase family protein [Nocardioides sp. S-1144]